MNAANQLTVSRMVLVPFYLVFLYYSKTEGGVYLWLSLAIFLSVAVGDAFDGYIARKLSQVTALGSFLDPLADKMILWVSLIILSYYDRVPFWLAILILSKDLLIFLGGVVLHLLDCDCTIKPNIWGKGASASQFLLVLCTLLWIGLGWFGAPLSNYFFWVLWLSAASMTTVSGISYALEESRRYNRTG